MRSVPLKDAVYNRRKTKFMACFKLRVSADYFCRTQYYFLLRAESAFYCLFHLVLIALFWVASSLLSGLSS